MTKKGITQIGILVRDVQEAVEQFWEILGIGPWSIYTFTKDTVENFTVYGKAVKGPFKFVVAKNMFGNIDIELIQHIEGKTVYEDFIKEKGYGLHHIKEQMDDEKLEEALGAYREKGIDIIQSGKFGENVHYYLNTEPILGVIYEIGNFGKIPKPERQYPFEAEKQKKR